MRIEQKIVDECNDLARTFYEMQGCQVPDGYKFYEATHPAEAGCWQLAMAAYDHIEGTDVESALDDLRDSDDTPSP